MSPLGQHADSRKVLEDDPRGGVVVPLELEGGGASRICLDSNRLLSLRHNLR